MPVYVKVPLVVTALIIFIITYIFIGLRQIPRIRIDRPAGALVGALITAVTVAIGILVLVVEVKIGNGAELSVVTGQASQKNVIVTSGGKKALERTFRVALFCDTDDLRTRGLQGFRRLAADEAALFVFDDLVEVTFWMGSVDFPIDIIFVGQDRKVVQVYQNCKPGSLDLYPSVKPALWVMETAAGSGIRVGDRIGFK